jgi:PAS domain S-box-containing protein
MSRAQSEPALGEVSPEALARLLEAFDQAPTAVAVLRGPGLIYDYANEPWRALAQRTDLIGTGFGATRANLGATQELLRQVLRSGHAFGDAQRMMPLRGHDGRDLDAVLSVRVQPLRDASGVPTRLLVLANDVTAEVRARQELEQQVERSQRDREALARSEARLQRIVDSNIAGICFWKLDGQLLEANDAFLRIVGYSRDDVRTGSLNWAALTTTEMSHQRAAALVSLQEHGVYPTTELSLLRKDGEAVPVLIGGALPEGGETGVSFVIDRSESTRKEAALRRAEERMRMLLEAAPVSLFAFDVAGVITASEGRALREHRHEPMGRPPFEPWLGRPGLSWLVAPVLQGREVRERIQVGERVVEVLARPLLGKDGKVGGGIGAGVDVTEGVRAAEERTRLQDRLVQVEKLEGLGVLAGGIAHDFNNLLAGILGNASVALGDLPEGHPAREPLHDVIQDARRATSLTRQMLAYAGRTTPTPEPIDLSEQVRALEPELPRDERVRLALRLEGALPPVRGDADQLRQALLALVANAREALPERSGSLIISTRLVELSDQEGSELDAGTALPAGWYAQLEVTDDGAGMDEATKQRAFDPFFSTKFAGRGLGLAAVLGIVRAHRGGVRLRSASGKGTTVTLYLPLASETGRPRPPPPRLEGRVAPHGVLIVDDEPQVRAAARRLLQSHGHQVSEASGGGEAVRVLRSSDGGIGVVLLDLSMPGPSGAQIFRELREVEPHVRIILCSGYPREVAAAQMGVPQLSSFLAKPYTPEELLEQVSAELARA